MKKPCNMDREVADLLVSTQFLKPADLDRAFAACRDRGLPLSKVLLNHKAVAQQVLVAAMQVAVEINEKRLTAAAGREVLHLMGQFGIPLCEAMHKVGVTAVRSPWASSLDRLWWGSPSDGGKGHPS